MMSNVLYIWLYKVNNRIRCLISKWTDTSIKTIVSQKRYSLSRRSNEWHKEDLLQVSLFLIRVGFLAYMPRSHCVFMCLCGYVSVCVCMCRCECVCACVCVCARVCHLPNFSLSFSKHAPPPLCTATISCLMFST